MSKTISLLKEYINTDVYDDILKEESDELSAYRVKINTKVGKLYSDNIKLITFMTKKNTSLVKKDKERLLNSDKVVEFRTNDYNTDAFFVYRPVSRVLQDIQSSLLALDYSDIKEFFIPIYFDEYYGLNNRLEKMFDIPYIKEYNVEGVSDLCDKIYVSKNNGTIKLTGKDIVDTIDVIEKLQSIIKTNTKKEMILVKRYVKTIEFNLFEKRALSMDRDIEAKIIDKFPLLQEEAYNAIMKIQEKFLDYASYSLSIAKNYIKRI